MLYKNLKGFKWQDENSIGQYQVLVQPNGGTAKIVVGEPFGFHLISSGIN
jgi:hypothetical protein